MGKQAHDWDSHRRDQAVEDLEFMARHGEPVSLACLRVGMTVVAAEKLLERRGRHDIMRALRAAEKSCTSDI